MSHPAAGCDNSLRTVQMKFLWDHLTVSETGSWHFSDVWIGAAASNTIEPSHPPDIVISQVCWGVKAELLSQALSSLPTSLYVPSTECNTMNAFEDRLSKSVNPVSICTIHCVKTKHNNVSLSPIKHELPTDWISRQYFCYLRLCLDNLKPLITHNSIISC